MTQDDEGERRAIEVLRERVQDVDLDAPLRILVVGVVPYAQHGGVHLHGLLAPRGYRPTGRRGRGFLQVGDGVVGASCGDGGVACCAGDADLGGECGDAGMVERRVAVVDA